MLIRKEFLSIGEVAQVTGLPVHTLRYWESEFSRFFSPLRTSGRQRRYSEDEVRRIMEIKKLLREDKYSIAGAKQVLSSRKEQARAAEMAVREADGGSREGLNPGTAESKKRLGLVKTGGGSVFNLAELGRV